MARCDEPATCACVVQPGSGLTVTGDGSAANPYVVSLSGALATDLGVSDTASLNLTVTGDGSAGNPYVVSGVVPDGVVVPHTNATLDLVGAKVATGLAFNPTTRETSVAVSGDAGNALALGDDGGLFTPTPEAANISTDPDNTLVLGTDTKLFVPPPPPAGGGGGYLRAEVASIVDQFTLLADIDGGALGQSVSRPADVPLPAPGDFIFVMPPDGVTTPAYFLMVGSVASYRGWTTAGVSSLSPLKVDVVGGPANVAADAMPGYTPVLGDNVAVLQRGGPNNAFLILGLAP